MKLHRFNKEAQKTGRQRVKIRRIISIILAAASLFIIPACTGGQTEARKCTVIFEDNPDISLSKSIYEVRLNTNLTVALSVPSDRAITHVSYENSTLSPMSNGASSSRNYYELTLYSIAYSALIRFTVEDRREITYNSGDGESFTVQSASPHLRPNTSLWEGQFERQGYLATGWNTLPDGNGMHTGFGSRIAADGDIELYVDWKKCTGEDSFTWRKEDGGAVITGYEGEGDLIIPSTLGNLPVRRIAEGAFGEICADSVALPHTLERIDDGAFEVLDCENLYLFDNLYELSERSFGDYSVNRLHVNAAVAPVYSGNYFATFADKVDWLESISDQKKIVFFCGSSARFGYDSTRFVAAFPQYNVANMGAFAYSNMRPQAEIIANYLREGDIVISSPELDAIDEQFCSELAFDGWTFCLMEANYDMLAGIDLGEYTGIFGSFYEYNAVRRTMQTTSYDDSPSYYKEDGSRSDMSSYNKYGDYVVFRETNDSSLPLSGDKKAYFNPDHIDESDWAGLNYAYDLFESRGADVYFAYSVRSELGLSDDTTEESISALEEAVKTHLDVPVLNGAHDAIMDPKYFFDTDNHLNTDGAALHSLKTIEQLKAAAEGKL